MKNLIDNSYFIYLILSTPEMFSSPVGAGRKQAKKIRNTCKVISHQIHTINKIKKLREIKDKHYRI